MQWTNPLCFALAILLTSSTFAAAPPLEDRKWMNLYDGPAPGALGEGDKHTPAIQAYLPPKDRATGATIIVLPGGAYAMLAMDHEGKQIGEFLNSHGITAFVVRYRLGTDGYKHPVMMHDAQRAIRTVRAHAKEWNLDPDRIGIIGFSAGGHLASTVSTHFDAGKPDASDPIDRVSSRPDCSTLVYPVITFGRHAHVGSRQHLLGNNPDPKLVEFLSNEKQVTKDTPPTFLMHSTGDKGVIVENSDMYAGMLAMHGVKYTYVRGDLGPHGVGLTDQWKPQWTKWLQDLNYAARPDQPAAPKKKE